MGLYEWGGEWNQGMYMGGIGNRMSDGEGTARVGSTVQARTGNGGNSHGFSYYDQLSK